MSRVTVAQFAPRTPTAAACQLNRAVDKPAPYGTLLKLHLVFSETARDIPHQIHICSATPPGGALSSGPPALPAVGEGLRQDGSFASRDPTAGGKRWAASTALPWAGDPPWSGFATSSRAAGGPRPSGGQ